MATSKTFWVVVLENGQSQAGDVKGRAVGAGVVGEIHYDVQLFNA